ncbi:MAG: hypothetical protein AAF696_37650, partial [Bacteroidota bacterium]
GKFISQAFIKDKRIEAYSAKNPGIFEQLYSQVFHSPSSHYSSQSKLSHQQVLHHLQLELGEDKSVLEIRKENSVPKLYISGEQAPIDLSISHHGRWGSFAYVHTPLC